MSAGNLHRPSATRRMGTRVGPLTLSHLLASGANGEVWAARTAHFEFVAVKILAPHVAAAGHLPRFEREIQFLRAHHGLAGVMPILDDGGSRRSRVIGASVDDPDPRWFTMPMCTPLRQSLGDQPLNDEALRTALSAFVVFATALAELHRRGFGHTDLNPSQLFALGDRWVIGDWGFAVHPDDPSIPRQGATGRGPNEWMPLEQVIQPESAHFGPTDVYSLARSLLILARAGEVPSRLARVLAGAMVSDPSRRPSMAQLAKQLSEVHTRW